MRRVVLHRTEVPGTWTVHGTGLLIRRAFDGGGYRLRTFEPPTQDWLARQSVDLSGRFLTLREARRALTALFAISPAPASIETSTLIRIRPGVHRTPDGRWQVERQSADGRWAILLRPTEPDETFPPTRVAQTDTLTVAASLIGQKQWAGRWQRLTR